MKTPSSRFVSTALAAWLACASLEAGNSFFATAKVLPSVESDGSVSPAFKSAGVTLVRHNIPGEAATQLEGPDPAFPGKIFTKDPGTGYFLADVGAQWASPISMGQPVLGIVEAVDGQFAWQGDGYVGASTGNIEKSSISRALLTLPEVWISKIPKPTFVSASESEIRIKIEHFSNVSGLAVGLVLRRREVGVQNWSYHSTVSLPPLAGLELTDSSVQAGKIYEYSAGVNFGWPGGTGIGSLPLETGLYSSMAVSKGLPMAASATQPSPMGASPAKSPTQASLHLEDGWLSYPNPVLGNDIQMAIDMPWPGSALAKIYSIDGEKVRDWRQSFEAKGQVRATMGLAGLSSGIYIMKLFVESFQGQQIELKAKKIAILR